MRRRALIPIVLLVSLLAAARPADAQSNGWVEITTDAVLEEIILLTEAGAFTPDPVLTTFVDEYGWGFEPSERDDLLDLLYEYDNDGNGMVGAEPADLSPEAAAALELLPSSTRDALTAGQTAFLEPDAYLDGLSDLLRRRGASPTGARDPGERAVLEAFVVEYANRGQWTVDDYLDPTLAPTTTTTQPTTSAPTTAAPTTASSTTEAPSTTAAPTTTEPVTTASPAGVGEDDPSLGELSGATTSPEETEADGGQDTDPVDEEAATGQPGTAADGAQTPDDLAFSADRDDDPTSPNDTTDDGRGDGTASGTGTPWGLVIAAVLITLGGAVVASRWWSGRRADDSQFRRFAEIGRKLAAGTSLVDVVETAMTETVRFTGAEAAAYHELTPGGLQLVGASDPDRYSPGSVVASLLSDVVSSGQANRAVVEWDPAIDEQTASMAATPVVEAGSIIGVISVVRAPSNPFGIEVLESLAALAPMLSSALDRARTLEEAVQESAVDWLTQLPNRRRFDDDLSKLSGFDRPICVAMVDIDHFKSFNDTYGHETGDVVIRSVAESLTTSLGPRGMAYRYGGEEFSVLLVGDVRTAATTMERARVAIQQMALPETSATRQSGGTQVTVSIGLAAGPTDEIASLLRLADQAMYAAKHGGRNRVVVGVHTADAEETTSG